MLESLLALLALPVMPIALAIALTFSDESWSFAAHEAALVLGIAVGVTWLVGPLLSSVALLRGFGSGGIGSSMLTGAAALTSLAHVAVGSFAAVLSVMGGLVPGDLVISLVVVALGIMLGWVFLDARRHPGQRLAAPVERLTPPRPDLPPDRPDGG